MQTVRALARATPHVNGFRIGTSMRLLDQPGAVNRTAELGHALAALAATPTVRSSGP